MRYAKWTLGLWLIALAAVASAQKPEPPDPAPLDEVDFPEYESRRLGNGLTVYAIEHNEQPVVSIRLLIAAGAAADPANLPGVASFTVNLLEQGTQTRSATELAEAIDRAGGTIEVSADRDSTTLSAAFLKEHVDLAFELMKDMVQNPAFAAEELERLRQQSLSSLTASLEDPDFLADAVLGRVLYGAHPYGHLQGGTPESIAAIQREDITKFHQTFYAPNISALVIAGDLPAARMFELAERHFGSWTRKDVPALDLTEVPAGQRRIVIVDRPGSVQTELRVGQLMVARNDPAYFEFLLASLVLGGSAEARLNQELRVSRGLTYGAFSSIQPRRGPGVFYAITDTRTEKTGEALNLVLAEIERLQSTVIPDSELTHAKTLIIGGFPLTIEVPADLAARLSTVFLYDLGDDYLETYRDRIAAVSGEDILKMAMERIAADKAAIVLVGDAGAFRGSLEGLGEIEVIPSSELNLGSPNLR